jgi:hypothetical protein
MVPSPLWHLSKHHALLRPKTNNNRAIEDIKRLPIKWKGTNLIYQGYLNINTMYILAIYKEKIQPWPIYKKVPFTILHVEKKDVKHMIKKLAKKFIKVPWCVYIRATFVN